MTNQNKWLTHLVLFIVTGFVIVLLGVNNYAYAADITVERPEKNNEGDFNDADYTYSYNWKNYYNFTSPVSLTGNTESQKEYILDLKNSDEIIISICGEFYCPHKSTCINKNKSTFGPIKVTVNIGNGKLIKTLDVELKVANGTTLTYATPQKKYIIDDLARFGFGEENVNFYISNLGNGYCDGCSNLIKKGIKIFGIESYDYRGLCDDITYTSDSALNAVTVCASVNEYVKKCEWYILFEGDDKETLLCDGIMENGMFVSGAKTNRVTIQKMPQNKGKMATVYLLTYDENNQGLTNLNSGEFVYKTDIEIGTKFDTGLNDIIANTGQNVSFDLASKIPADTRTIKWQNSSDGNKFSDNFGTATFAGKVNSSNNAVLKINGVTSLMNGYYFRCICIDEYGRECVSDSFRMYVNKPCFFYNNNPISAVYINGKKVL